MTTGLRILAWAFLVAAVAVTLGLRFRHPDLSETRLFLAFWPIWLGVFAYVGCAAWLFRKASAA